MKIQYLILLLLLIPCVSALPTTGAASAISSNNVSLAATGVTTTAWFEYGMTSGSLIWKTPNQSASGVYNRVVMGSPLMSGQKFYYRVCDVTGCGAESFFTLTVATLQPQTTFGYVYQNVTESGFDPGMIGMNAMQPYLWVSPANIVWAMLFFFMFAGLWMRGRDVTIPTILGLLIGFVIFNPTYGVAMDPAFISMSQGLAYASIAGIVMSIFKK
jgi:hypothetical protein